MLKLPPCTEQAAIADQKGLLNWVEAFEKKPEVIFVNHGDTEVCEAFQALLQKKGYVAVAPFSNAEFDLISGKFLAFPEGRPIAKRGTEEGRLRRADRGGTAPASRGAELQGTSEPRSDPLHCADPSAYRRWEKKSKYYNACRTDIKKKHSILGGISAAPPGVFLRSTC